MKVIVKWFLTGKTSEVEEPNDILNPNSTIAEVKGLMQIRFGFQAKEIVLLKDHLLDNTVVLHTLGITGQPTDPVLTAHVVKESDLEASNLDADDTSKDDDLQEFSHADFLLAMKMLGKDVPVPDDRLIAMRLNAPRQRPAFLNSAAPGGPDDDDDSSPAPPPNMPGIPKGATIAVYDPKKTEVYQIFARVQYGLRKEGVDQSLAIPYPDVEPFPFWDMRTPDPFATKIAGHCQPGEVCLELFFFGEFTAIKDTSKFVEMVKRIVESKAGVRLRTPFPMREAGCMYPLVAVPVIMHEMDAWDLGDFCFEQFGKAAPKVKSAGALSNDPAVAGSSDQCSMM